MENFLKKKVDPIKFIPLLDQFKQVGIISQWGFLSVRKEYTELREKFPTNRRT